MTAAPGLTSADTPPAPVRIAVLNDYEVVLQGVIKLFKPFKARLTVQELSATVPSREPVDIVLYDTFASTRNVSGVFRDIRADKLVLYTSNIHPELVDTALRGGADGILSKSLPVEDLVSTLERIHAGEIIIFDATIPRTPSTVEPAGRRAWPGRSSGLSERESEVVALFTRGLSNQEIADRAYLTLNTVKTHIREAYQKMDVTKRSQAVLWGIEHGFTPDRTTLTFPTSDEAASGTPRGAPGL